jgi:hypothetical protein
MDGVHYPNLCMSFLLFKKIITNKNVHYENVCGMGIEGLWKTIVFFCIFIMGMKTYIVGL